ncbi:hypothetical protein [Brevundimonas sp. AAP58]|uniref:hypothetical protein n=1 Tax=Brevundimonas sp. AAP58 TaxID=1523422 RepID=UPI000A4F7ED6|nr:hypothetical protein [Brevundimonas sp. AAP58]
MRLFCLSLLAGLAILAAPQARADGFDRTAFEVFVDARTGTGSPVYWYSVGTLRAYPSGELLARVEGYDTSTSDRPEPGRSLARQFSRKIYVYRDAETNAVLRQVNGMPVEPVAYPYQFITYELVGDRLTTMVEQGTGARVQRIGPGDTMQARRIGDAHVFTAPLFLDFPAGGDRRYQAFENYDFFIQAPGGASNPNQLSWVRYGDAPAWAGGGPAIMHLITWRIDRYEDVPSTLRDYIETDAPLWRAPPTGIDDIRRLQAGQ